MHPPTGEENALSIDQTIDQAFRPIAQAFSKIVFFSIPVGGVELPLIVAFLVAGAAFFTVYLGFINVRGFRHAIRAWAGTDSRACSGITSASGPSSG